MPYEAISAATAISSATRRTERELELMAACGAGSPRYVDRERVFG